MSDIFAMTDATADAKLAAANANNVDSLKDLDSPLFRGTFTGAFSGVVRGVANLNDFLLTGTDLVFPMTDEVREQQQYLREHALDAWTPRANEVGRVGQVLGSLGEIAAPLTVGGAPVLAGTTTLAGGKRLVDEGVDSGTAGIAAAVEGAASYAGLKVPIVGKTLTQRMLAGAGGNLALGSASRSAEGAVLRSQGYEQQSQAFAVDATALTTDALTGLLFGTVVHATAPRFNPKLNPAQIDAVLTARNAKSFAQGTAPGTPDNLRSDVAHTDTLGDALNQLAETGIVDVGAKVAQHDGASFTPGPQIEASREAAANVEAGLPNDVPYPDPEPDLENFGTTMPPRTLADSDPLLVPRDTDASPERVALRDAIVARQVEGARTVEGRKPVATLMGGGGASGKGTILRFLESKGLIKADGAVHIDPDELKAEIPEYKAIIAKGDSRAAAVVHEESSALAKRVLAAAIEKNADIILDRTLADPMKALAEIRMLKAAGYEVQLHGVTVDPVNAVRRADRRAQRTMRFVPPRELLKAHKGFAAGFEKLAAEADHTTLYDNEVPEGTAPRMLASQESGKSLQVHDESGYNSFRQRSQINEQGTTARTVRAGVDATLAGRNPQGADLGNARGDAGSHEGQPGAPRRPPAPGDLSRQGVNPPVSRLSLKDALASKPEAGGETLPELEALRQLAESQPDTVVYNGRDEDGNPVKTTVADEFERVSAEYERDIHEAGVYEIAATCFLGHGA